MAGRLLIVDRDGVINEDSDAFIKDPEEWRPISGSLAALGEATAAGFRIFVVSNQSGLARGLFKPEQLHRIHHRLLREAQTHGAAIEAFLFCPHGPRENCACRKPKPGMLQTLAARSGLALSGSIMVGDRASDIDAARAAGATPWLVRTGHGDANAAYAQQLGVPVFADLASAVRALCRGGAP